jgi:hypothetical protein
MSTEPNKTDKQQEPIKADLETILRKQIEMEEKLDRMLAIIAPPPEPTKGFDAENIKGVGLDESKLPVRHFTPRTFTPGT